MQFTFHTFFCLCKLFCPLESYVSEISDFLLPNLYAELIPRTVDEPLHFAMAFTVLKQQTTRLVRNDFLAFDTRSPTHSQEAEFKEPALVANLKPRADWPMTDGDCNEIIVWFSPEMRSPGSYRRVVQMPTLNDVCEVLPAIADDVNGSISRENLSLWVKIHTKHWSPIKKYFHV